MKNNMFCMLLHSNRPTCFATCRYINGFFYLSLKDVRMKQVFNFYNLLLWVKYHNNTIPLNSREICSLFLLESPLFLFPMLVFTANNKLLKKKYLKIYIFRLSLIVYLSNLGNSGFKKVKYDLWRYKIVINT